MSILPTSVYAQGGAYNKGYNDASCDAVSCHGHGYEPSCPSDHSSEYCSNYRDGYAAGWDASSSASGGSSSTYPPPTCSDESNSDSNGNCASDSRQQSSGHTGLGDTVCNLVNSGEVDALGALLAPLHIISGGTTAGILAAGHAYCLLHGSSVGN